MSSRRAGLAALALRMVLVALCATGVALAARPATVVWTADQVAAWMSEATGGLIQLAPGVDPSTLRYYRSLDPPDRFVPTAPRDPNLDQEAYTFDVDAFVRQQGAPDFLEAKRRFYEGLWWNDRDQAHAVPYPRPTAWQTLNHPPIKTLDGPRERWTHLWTTPPADTDPARTHPFFDPAFQRALDEATGTELTHGNEMLLLSNGDAWTEKLRLVADTRERLYVAVMFWACDESSDALADAMIAKVRDGVDVRVITEGIYRETITRRCLDRLAMGGVKVLSAPAALRPASFGSVMHRKVWIRDGEELILGGQNILDYENHADGFNLLNRDTDVRVRGPAVTDAERAWVQAWLQHDRDPALLPVLARSQEQTARQRADGVRGAEAYPRWLGDPATRMAGNCRVVMQGVNAASQPIGPLVERYLDATREQVVFSSPTVRYDPHHPANRDNHGLCMHRLMERLHDKQGPLDPEVLVLTNGIGGAIGESSMWIRNRRDGAWEARQWFLYRLARQYGDLVGRRASVANRAATVPLSENPNVEVWTYFQYIHSKIWLFDRVATMISSWNLEINSTELNPEAALFCLDADLRDRVEDDLTLALVNSVPEDSASSPKERRWPWRKGRGAARGAAP